MTDIFNHPMCTSIVFDDAKLINGINTEGIIYRGVEITHDDNGFTGYGKFLGAYFDDNGDEKIDDDYTWETYFVDKPFTDLINLIDESLFWRDDQNSIITYKDDDTCGETHAHNKHYRDPSHICNGVNSVEYGVVDLYA
jgi:hypothetical protein